MPDETTTLRSLIIGQQAKLEVTLAHARRVIAHPTTKGDAHELNWVKVIDDFLPRRYSVCRGIVIDAYGATSEQQDVVIYDEQYCPLFLEEGGVRFIPAESVYGVIEVKQELSSALMEAAAVKVSSVRALHRTNMPVPTATGLVRQPNPLFEILGGIVTLGSAWSPPLGGAFEEALTREPAERRLDLGCSLQHGAFAVDYDTKGTSTIDRSEPDGSLMAFLQRLYSMLQAKATVPVMDLELYTQGLEAAPIDGSAF